MKKMMSCRVEKTVCCRVYVCIFLVKVRFISPFCKCFPNKMLSFSFPFLSCVFILSLSVYFPVSYLFSPFSFLTFVCL